MPERRIPIYFLSQVNAAYILYFYLFNDYYMYKMHMLVYIYVCAYVLYVPSHSTIVKSRFSIKLLCMKNTYPKK